jgi:hypothetical protein
MEFDTFVSRAKTDASVGRPSFVYHQPASKDFGSGFLNQSMTSCQCRVVRFQAPYRQGPWMVQEMPGRSIGEIRITQAFGMLASFSNEQPYDCACCEYRQLVRGYIRVRQTGGEWYDIDHALRFGEPLDPDEYQEDGLIDGRAYGYRNIATNLDAYLPVRITGCEYEGRDAPGIYRLRTDHECQIHLDFLGRIVRRDGRIIRQRHWLVQYRGPTRVATVV